MGEMKVEHVLLFLVGAFLVYHMMGKCREGLKACVGEAVDVSQSCFDNAIFLKDMPSEVISVDGGEKKYAKQQCGKNYYYDGWFNNYQCDGIPVRSKNTVNGDIMWMCTEGKNKCSNP